MRAFTLEKRKPTSLGFEEGEEKNSQVLEPPTMCGEAQNSEEDDQMDKKKREE